MKNQQTEKKLVKINYAIIDGEHEYADSFLMKANDAISKKRIYKEIARMYTGELDNEAEFISSMIKDGMAMIGYRAIKRVSVSEFDTITVLVRGGVIQDIQNIPEGIRIRVQDYDIESLTEEEQKDKTEPDSNGDRCIVSDWENQCFPDPVIKIQ